jgi:hypothetical protein
MSAKKYYMVNILLTELSIGGSFRPLPKNEYLIPCFKSKAKAMKMANSAVPKCGITLITDN